MRCQMRDDCESPVTHIDNKGYVYCADHGPQRRASGTPCRKLTRAELNTLRSGQPIASYSRRPAKRLRERTSYADRQPDREPTVFDD